MTVVNVKNLILYIALSLSPLNSFAFEIFALGTSNTNCKEGGQAFTKTLNELLIQAGISGTVINAGVNGDRPIFMMNRLKQGLEIYTNVKLVLFEPGANDRNANSNLESTEEILAYLQKHHLPTIFMSHRAIQPEDADAKKMADKYDAYYYGHWARNIPGDTEYWTNRHMTEKSCRLWAEAIFPLIKKALKESNIN